MNILSSSLLACVVAVCLFLSDPARAAPREAEAPPVTSLRALYRDDAGFRATIDRALASVRKPEDGSENPWRGRSFDDLCRFFDDWYRLVPVNGDPQRDEFEYIKKFAWFYHRNEDGLRVVNTEPGLGWSREFVAARGRFMDSPASTTTIPRWVADPSSAIAEYVVPPGGFRSFNDFFTRSLKPGVRPIASPIDDAVLVSPADCALNMIDPLKPGKRIATKLRQSLDVRELLGGSAYARHFENGTAISCILLPDTYHHYHAVTGGRVVESREDVAGAYWGIPDLSAFLNRGNIGYGSSYSAFEHFRRGYFVIETREHGYVAMVAVGLDTIGSVVFEEPWRNVSAERPVSVQKGDRLGHFAYGGSLVITLVEQGVAGIAIPQGQRIGVFARKKPSP